MGKLVGNGDKLRKQVSLAASTELGSKVKTAKFKDREFISSESRMPRKISSPDVGFVALRCLPDPGRRAAGKVERQLNVVSKFIT